MSIRKEVLLSDHFYHIFNRGINRQKIFLNDDNYNYFLIKITDYLSPVLDIYSYCLMPNHFHLLIKVKSQETLDAFWQQKSIKNQDEKGLHIPEKIVSKQFANFFNAYTQAFNKMHARNGALFDSPFKRKLISSEAYLKTAIIYMHQNPSDLGKIYRNYKYSSYQAIVSNSHTNVRRNEVVNLFSDVENFKYVHSKPTTIGYF